MNKIRQRALLAAILTAVAATLFLNSCKKDKDKDPCDDLECHNGGTCNGGECHCSGWYEGVACSTEMRQKFLATDAVVINEACLPTSLSGGSYLINIVPGNAVDQIQFENFLSCASVPAKLIGSNAFVILEQNFCNDSITLSGHGEYDSGNNVVIEYDIRFNYLPVGYDEWSCEATIDLGP